MACETGEKLARIQTLLLGRPPGPCIFEQLKLCGGSCGRLALSPKEAQELAERQVDRFYNQLEAHQDFISPSSPDQG